ncbi:MAG: hypothetical protein M3O50_07070, partial [Myxococcota bacterium]|nr:hypothetical protein [Myxococcota bacterium]
MSLGVSGPSSAGGRVGGASRPGFLEATHAAEAIRRAVGSAPGGLLTVADAAAKSGLALRDAENGLKWLSSEYRGQLRVTDEGELVHVFPTGFTKPWETRDAWSNAARAAGRGVMGALRFVVRAWVAIVLVGYTAIFLGLVIGMAFARQGNDDRRSGGGLPGGALAYAFSRIVADALFWTFHPWSPFAMGYAPGGAWDSRGNDWSQARRRRDQPKIPLYERVNRFFFGPTEPPPDPRETERLAVAAIRAGKGRIGLADVMRVTGLPRDQADPMMARLMLDYDGDVHVSEEGGIVYRFAAMRKTASEASEPEPPAAWTRLKPMPMLTGNPLGANVIIFLLNGFNLLMGLWAIENGLTLERAAHLFDRFPRPIVDTGVPLVLGVIPFAFSALLFMLPLARLVVRPLRQRAFSAERGRLAVLREVLERVRGKQPVTDAQLAEAWRSATGQRPDPKRLGRELVAL